MQDQQESVHHLVKLGYVDPDETAAREAERRRVLQSQFQQAVELYRQGDDNQAATMLESIAADALGWSPPHQVLVEIHYKAGRQSETQAELEWLEHHGVDHPRVALIRAAIALSRRELQMAFQELEYAREVEPNLPSVNTLFGTVLLRLGRFDAAEDAFREAAQQNLADARARDGLAAVFLRHGEYEAAADWALRALEQDMQLFAAHYHLGVALLHLNRPSEAIAALETSAKLESSRAAPYFWLSKITGEQLRDAPRAGRYRELGRETIRQRRERSTHQRLL